jgi:hypothetical protein
MRVIRFAVRFAMSCSPFDPLIELVDDRVAAERPTRMTARLHDLRPEVEEEVKALPGAERSLATGSAAVLARRPELPREAAVPCVVEGKCRRLKRLSSASPF